MENSTCAFLSRAPASLFTPRAEFRSDEHSTQSGMPPSREPRALPGGARSGGRWVWAVFPQRRSLVSSSGARDPSARCVLRWLALARGSPLL